MKEATRRRIEQVIGNVGGTIAVVMWVSVGLMMIAALAAAIYSGVTGR